MAGQGLEPQVPPARESPQDPSLCQQGLRLHGTMGRGKSHLGLLLVPCGQWPLLLEGHVMSSMFPGWSGPHWSPAVREEVKGWCKWGTGPEGCQFHRLRGCLLGIQGNKSSSPQLSRWHQDWAMSPLQYVVANSLPGTGYSCQVSLHQPADNSLLQCLCLVLACQDPLMWPSFSLSDQSDPLSIGSLLLPAALT